MHVLVCQIYAPQAVHFKTCTHASPNKRAVESARAQSGWNFCEWGASLEVRPEEIAADHQEYTDGDLHRHAKQPLSHHSERARVRVVQTDLLAAPVSPQPTHARIWAEQGVRCDGKRWRASSVDTASERPVFVPHIMHKRAPVAKHLLPGRAVIVPTK